ncbi:hypothetical protein B484DRAFT_324157 [Ochromonadaceae sp. CCMP2298]|nr:hypothetical protein B484DRAFT_324157 [Ochromonadaceae sp. CCMP2298]
MTSLCPRTAAAIRAFVPSLSFALTSSFLVSKSSSTISWCPSEAAAIRALMPSPLTAAGGVTSSSSTTCTTAPASTSIFEVPMCPPCAATISAVTPSLCGSTSSLPSAMALVTCSMYSAVACTTTFTSALFSIKKAVVSLCPPPAANITAVPPDLATWFTSSPLASRMRQIIFTTSRCPWAEAIMSGLKPVSDITFTSALASNSILTIGTEPFSAALMSAVSPSLSLLCTSHLAPTSAFTTSW